jgi:O-antigen ligase
MPQSAIASPSRGRLSYWAIGAVYGLAFFAPFSIALGQIAQGVLLIVAGTYLQRHWSGLRSSPLIWLTGAYALYVLTRGVMAATVEAPLITLPRWPEAMDAPTLAAAHWEETFRWLRSGPVMIILIAIGLVATGNWLRHSLGTLVALVLGTMILFAREVDLSNLLSAVQQGKRYQGGLNFFLDSLKLAILPLGLLAFAPLLLQHSRNRLWLGLGLVIWIGLMAAAAIGLLALQTRSVWLACLVGLIVTIAAAAWYNRGQWHSSENRKAIFVGVAGFLILGGATAAFWEPIMSRWHSGGAGSTLTLALTTPPTSWGHKLPENSVGIRAAYVDVALDLYADRPIIGYGPADPRYLREGFPNLPEKLEARRGHFHNTYLEFLLSFGGIGFALFAAPFLLVAQEAHRLGRARGTARLLGPFTLAVLATLFVFGFTTVNFERFHLAHFYGVLLAPVLAAMLARHLTGGRQSWDPGDAHQPPFGTKA